MRGTMSNRPPAAADRQLPRSHLLVPNRSFRRTLEAENKSSRPMQAYTDAVRLLAAYCQAHGHPILAGELRREHIQIDTGMRRAECAGMTADDVKAMGCRVGAAAPSGGCF
jgi:hypothetical protein